VTIVSILKTKFDLLCCVVSQDSHLLCPIDFVIGWALLFLFCGCSLGRVSFRFSVFVYLLVTFRGLLSLCFCLSWGVSYLLAAL